MIDTTTTTNRDQALLANRILLSMKLHNRSMTATELGAMSHDNQGVAMKMSDVVKALHLLERTSRISVNRYTDDPHTYQHVPHAPPVAVPAEDEEIITLELPHGSVAELLSANIGSTNKLTADMMRVCHIALRRDAEIAADDMRHIAATMANLCSATAVANKLAQEH